MSYETVNGIKYYLIFNSYYIIGNNGSTDGNGVTSQAISGEIVIPEKVKGLDILEIGTSAFGHCHKITKIIIHAKLRSINQFGLYGCTKLEYINIPATVTFLGWYSLYSGTGKAMVNLELTIEFVKGRTQKFYARKGVFNGRSKFKIIYPSNLVPLYGSENPFYESHGTSISIICAPSSFDFCRKQTTVGFSQCPPSSYVNPNFKGKTVKIRRNYRERVLIKVVLIIVITENEISEEKEVKGNRFVKAVKKVFNKIFHRKRSK